MFKKIVRNILISLLLFLSCTLIVGASAKLCNITIYSHINNDNNESIIIEDSFVLYKIANYSDEIYVKEESFKNFNISFNYITSSKLTELATSLKEYTIKNHIDPLLKVNNNAKGYAYFTNLEQGIYLIYQDKEDSKYITNPILINLPFKKDDKLIYDISIDAKYVDKEIVDSPQNQDHITDTSDNTNLDTWIMVCASSLIVFIVLMMYYFKSDKS